MTIARARTSPPSVQTVCGSPGPPGRIEFTGHPVKKRVPKRSACDRAR